MARKTDKRKTKEFTRNIHSTVRAGSGLANMDNWDEAKAKATNAVCCHDCRYFSSGCSEGLGKYHKPCGDFEWW